MVVRPFIKSLFEGEALRKLGASSPLELYLKYGEGILHSYIFGVTIQGIDLNTLDTTLKIIHISNKTIALVGSIPQWRDLFTTKGNNQELLEIIYSLILEENGIFKIKKDGKSWKLKGDK